MKENQVQSTAESTEPRSPEKKKYHPPEFAEYGDIRELTKTDIFTFSPVDASPPLEVTSA